MKSLEKTTWEQVFTGWRQRESQNPGWIHCATEIKGWPDWESWRNFSASQIQAADRNWEVHEFTDPMAEIPNMLIGPYGGWQSRLSEINTATFAELLEIEHQREFFSNHSLVREILNALPFPTQYIGLIREDINKIVCLDGHHRATAVTIAKKEGRQIAFPKAPTIALTKLPAAETHLLTTMLERGSHKIS